ncbi:hypothetical protein MMC08_000537 [Hypocenomyce scalaris]|nr:hypothetical protein [Hypocenomyce scalaris]
MTLNPSNDAPSEPKLVRFYSPTSPAPDHHGRTLSSILSWPDGRLETDHNFIQTLFPLPERSPHDRSAPLIDRVTFSAFRSRPELRARLRDSFVRLLEFYGLQLQETGDAGLRKVEVVPGDNFLEAAQAWIVESDHNHQRMTRIIRSLRILGLEQEAAAFFAALEKVNTANRGMIGQKSLMYWTRAAKRPLYVAPNQKEEDGRGKDFLYEYEDIRAAEKDGDAEETTTKKGRAEEKDGYVEETRSNKGTVEEQDGEVKRASSKV